MDRFDGFIGTSHAGKPARDSSGQLDGSGQRIKPPEDNLGFFSLTRFLDSFETNLICPSLVVNDPNAGQATFWGGQARPHFGWAVQADGLRTKKNVQFIPLGSSTSENKNDSSPPEKRPKLCVETQTKCGIPESIISPKVIDSLIRSINRSGNVEFIKTAAGTLYNISRDDRSLDLILKFDGIPVLISLLRSDAAIILIYAASVVQKLLLNREKANELVELADGTRKLIDLLNRGEQNLLAVVVDCLRILATKSDEVKLIILQCKGHNALVGILKVARNESLLWMTCRLLRVLSSNSKSKMAIVSAGGAAALTELLSSTKNEHVMFNCLSALKNLSDVMGTFDLLVKLVEFCVSALQSINISTVAFSVGILANATCHNSKNKSMAFKSGCVAALIRLARDPSSPDNIIEGAVYILKNLASKHRLCIAVRKELGENGASEMIGELLKPPYRWPIVKIVVELLRIMTSCRKVRKSFGCEGTLYDLLSLLDEAWQTIHECSRGAPRMSHNSDYVASVHAEDCMEGILLTLHHFASRSKENREAMIKQNVVNVSIDLLSHSMPIIQDAAVVLLLQLIRGPTSLEILKQPDTLRTLVRVFNSSPSAANRAKLFIEKVAPRKSFKLIATINELVPSNVVSIETTLKTTSFSPIPNNLDTNVSGYHQVEVATETSFTPQEASSGLYSWAGEDADPYFWGDNSNSLIAEADMAVWEALFGPALSDVMEDSFEF